MTAHSDTLDGTLVRGIAWVGGMKWLTQGVSWAVTLVVAHLLTPSDYGVIGMATVYLGLAQLVGDAGLIAVIIQAPALSEELAARIGGLGVVVGAVLCALSAGAGGPVAWFFNEPAVRWVVIAMSGNFLVRGFQVLPRGLLARELRFRDLAWIDAAESLTVAFTTLIGAALGMRYWALVAGALGGSVASTVVCLMRRRHAIRAPGDWHALRQSILLGGQVITSQIAWYTYSNADFAVVGRMLGKTALGAYTFGWTIASLPIDRLTSLVGRVAPPVFAAVQHDRAELRRHLSNLTEGIAVLTMPLCVGLALVAPEFVHVALGDAWRAAVVPLRLLALYAAFRCIVTLLPTVLLFTGHAKRNMQYSLAAVVVLPATFLVGSRWGLAGVALGWITVYPLFITATYVRYALGVLELSWTGYGRALWPAASATGVMTVVVLAVRAALPGSMGPVGRLAALVLAGAATYAGVVAALHGRRLLGVFRWLGRGPAHRPAPFHQTSGGESRRRLLLVSYHFPPSAAVGGLRWQKFARAAARHGWGLDVVTADPLGCDAVDLARLADLPPGVAVYGVSDDPPRLERVADALWRSVRDLVRRRRPNARPLPGVRPAPRRAGSRSRAEAARMGQWRDLTRVYHAWTEMRREAAWGRRAARVGDALLREGGHAAVISCGPPHFGHPPVSAMARRRGVPFVLDLRDPWSLIQRLPEDTASPLWLVRAAGAERRVVREAALVVANTVPARDAMQRRYPGQAARIIAVTNGFDFAPEGARRSPADGGVAESGRFTIAYAGTIYLDRDPRPLFRAAARVVESRGLRSDEFSIEFMGAVADYDGAPLEALAAECGVRDYVHLHPPRPHQEALAFIERAAMLVVLPQDSHLAVPAKVFEYARVAAWVLALAEPASATAQLLLATDADVVDPERVDLIARVITRRLTQFSRGERARPLARFEFLSREAQADLLFGALGRLVGSPREAEAPRRFEEERARIAPVAEFPAVAAGAVHEHRGHGAQARGG